MKTLLTFLALLLALTANSAVILLPLEGFPNTNVLEGSDLFFIRHTNTTAGTRTNKNILYRDLLTLISNAIPTSSTNFYTTNITIQTNTTGGGESLWTNMNGLVSLILGDTNSLKISTNGRQGIIIGDTNRAFSFFGWPANDLTFINVRDGSPGHTVNQIFPVAVVNSTGNGAYEGFYTESGSNPIFSHSSVAVTNAVVATQLDEVAQKGGGYILLRDVGSTNFVGIQNAAQLSTAIGPNHIRIFSHGAEKLILSTNGGVSFFGSATNYGRFYARSNLFLQNLALTTNRVLYLDAGREVVTATFAPTEVSTIANMMNASNVLSSLLGPGASKWTNQYDHSIVRLIAGSTNFIGGGTGNIIATNNTFSTIGGGRLNTISTNSSSSTISGGENNAIGVSSIYTTIAGGLNNTIQRGANGATILGGNGNTIQQDSQQTVIVGGANNLIGSNSIYSAILGGALNTIKTNTPFAFLIGNGATASNANALTVAFTNTTGVQIDATNLHLIGDMQILMTNGAAAGYVMTSDALGRLTLQSVGGGGGGGGGLSGTWIASSNGFGTNTTLRAPNIPTNSFLMYDGVAVLYGDKVAKNWFYGWSAGKTNAIAGIQNIGIGWGSLGSLTSGSYNAGLGNVSLYANTTGSRNTAGGFNANGVNTVGNDSTAYGYGVLESNTADSNTGLGSGALQNNTIGTFNLGVGVEALQRNTIGSLNTAVGSYDSMILNVSGSNNASFGYGNLYSNTNGQENTSLGALGSYYQQSGDRNVSVGFRAGSSNWIGSSNIVIGAYVQLSTTNLSNRMNIGNAISGDLTNKFVGIGTNEPSSALHVRPTRSGQSYLRVDDTNGTPRIQAGVFIGAPTIGALWFGNITPSSVNYSLASDGTGTTYVGGVNTLYLGTGGNTQWFINGGGFILANADNTYDIGASGASRPRAVHLGTGGFVQAFSVAAPIAPSAQGAAYWNDGTNVCVVLRNSAGTLTTNKLSMTAWP